MTRKNLEPVALHLSDSLAAEPSQPDPFYVATNGRDGNNGSIAHPLATVRQAVDVVPNGSTLIGLTPDGLLPILATYI